MRWGGVVVLSGAALGVAIALAFRDASPPEPSGNAATEGVAPVSPSPVAPGTAASASAPLAPASAPPKVAPASASIAGSAPGAAASTVAPLPAASAAAAPSGTAADAFPIAVPLPPVATAKELERAEIRCYEVDPEECGRAADAYDAGLLVRRDAARAANLRKVELTRLNRRCEQRSPHACLVLAGHYESGAGVDENDKHARALVAHARELCRHGAKKAECVDGEPK
jgi:hypothetical protein